MIANRKRNKPRSNERGLFQKNEILFERRYRVVIAVDEQGKPIVRVVYRLIFLAGILPLPVLIDGVRHLSQPGAILEQFQNIRRAEELDAIGRRVAERLEQPGGDERGNIVRLAVEHPAGLLRSEGGGAV